MRCDGIIGGSMGHGRPLRRAEGRGRARAVARERRSATLLDTRAAGLDHLAELGDFALDEARELLGL
ncbi:MAG: hypothetical protein ACK559_41140, partial [bacterium]